MVHVWKLGFACILLVITYVRADKGGSTDMDEYSSVIRSNLNLVNLLALSRQSRDVHADHATACFDKYLPVLSAHAKTYEKDYGDCLQLADKSKTAAENKALPVRKQLSQDVVNACGLFDVCNAKDELAEFFECYWHAGTKNVAHFYTIATNSSDAFTELKEGYHNIEVERTRCTSLADRHFVISAEKTHNEMESCLQGKSVAPTTTTGKPLGLTQAPTTVSTTLARVPEEDDETVETTTTGKPLTQPPTTVSTTLASVPDENDGTTISV